MVENFYENGVEKGVVFHIHPDCKKCQESVERERKMLEENRRVIEEELKNLLFPKKYETTSESVREEVGNPNGRHLYNVSLTFENLTHEEVNELMSKIKPYILMARGISIDPMED